MGLFNWGKQHQDWNDELEDKGLDNNDRKIECYKNYKAVLGSDRYEDVKDITDDNGKNRNTEFGNSEKDDNSKLQQEQVKEINNKSYNDKTEVKDDLRNVREDRNRWKNK